MALVDALMPEFDHEMSVTRKLLERVPEERFGWKPHEKSYTLGQLAQHVATLPMWGSITVNCWRSSMATSQARVPPLPGSQMRSSWHRGR